MATSDRARHARSPAPPASGPRDDGPWLALSQVMDHAILDRDGRRAGRVDDLLLRSSRDTSDGRPARQGRTEPVLTALVSGPLPRPAPWLVRVSARLCYLACGIRRPQPAVVAWRHVEAIDALVHLDVGRDEAGLRAVDRSVQRFIAKIPGAAGRRSADTPPSPAPPPAAAEPEEGVAGSLRFSALRGRRVTGSGRTTVGFVVDVIVRPAAGEQVVRRLVLVPRRMDLLVSRFAPRAGVFTIDARAIRSFHTHTWETDGTS